MITPYVGRPRVARPDAVSARAPAGHRTPGLPPRVPSPMPEVDAHVRACAAATPDRCAPRPAPTRRGGGVRRPAARRSGRRRPRPPPLRRWTSLPSTCVARRRTRSPGADPTAVGVEPDMGVLTPPGARRDPGQAGVRPPPGSVQPTLTWYEGCRPVGEVTAAGASSTSTAATRCRSARCAAARARASSYTLHPTVTPASGAPTSSSTTTASSAHASTTSERRRNALRRQRQPRTRVRIATSKPRSCHGVPRTAASAHGEPVRRFCRRTNDPHPLWNPRNTSLGGTGATMTHARPEALDAHWRVTNSRARERGR